ncbi:hypothetical protein FRB90_003580 [Tulasnella sp. 427]|nr:hypothetical protein FRB90_003580 [Tulasnella sp. 427]
MGRHSEGLYSTPDIELERLLSFDPPHNIVAMYLKTSVVEGFKLEKAKANKIFGVGVTSTENVNYNQDTASIVQAGRDSFGGGNNVAWDYRPEPRRTLLANGQVSIGPDRIAHTFARGEDAQNTAAAGAASGI